MDDVRRWLEQGGYILEMAVARKLRSFRPLFIEQGYVYKDIVTGKEREGDVPAAFIPPRQAASDQTVHALHLLIECKNTDAPWVFFMGRFGVNGPWSARSYFDYDCDVCLELADAMGQVVGSAPEAYAVSEKRKAGGSDHASAAVQQAASAVLSRFPENVEGHRERHATVLAEPIVVTGSPLLTCELGDDGGIILQETDRVSVLVPRADLPDKEADGVAVTVLNIEALENFVSSLLATFDAFGA